MELAAVDEHSRSAARSVGWKLSAEAQPGGQKASGWAAPDSRGAANRVVPVVAVRQSKAVSRFELLDDSKLLLRQVALVELDVPSGLPRRIDPLLRWSCVYAGGQDQQHRSEVAFHCILLCGSWQTSVQLRCPFSIGTDLVWASQRQRGTQPSARRFSVRASTRAERPSPGAPMLP